MAFAPQSKDCLYKGSISTYAQFSDLPLEELSNLIPGLSAGRETRQSWLKQAHHLASPRGDG